MGNLSEFDEAQCMWRLAYLLDESRSLPIIVQDTFLLSNPSFLGVRPCFEFSAHRWYFLRETIRRKLNLTAHLLLVSSLRICRGKSLLHFNQI